MSEQAKPKSFMQELDEWTVKNIVEPLTTSEPGGFDHWDTVVEEVKKAIRTKVLESYRNGQAAGPGRQPRTGYQPRRQFSKDH